MALVSIVTACGGNASPPSPRLTSCALVLKNLGKTAKCYTASVKIVKGVATYAFHGLTKPPFLSPQALADPTYHVAVENESKSSATFVVMDSTGKPAPVLTTLPFIVVVYNGV